MQSEGKTRGAPEPAVRKLWSPPRVIASELRSTHHQTGHYPSDKTTFTTDHMTASGSQGS